MRCIPCKGTGWVPKLVKVGHMGDKIKISIPCDECGGSGIAHCCEGLQAQPGDE